MYGEKTDASEGGSGGTEAIGRVPLGDAEAEYIFELLP